jgi:predicted chitinase
MKYQELNPAQLANAKLIDKAVVEIGLTNAFLRAGILAVCSKESGFKMVKEISYSNTPTSRIRQIFGLKNYTDLQIEALKKSDMDFFNVVYNRKDLGNLQVGDGYRFRGRGFNQLTGRANYTIIGKGIGIDIVSNPDLMDDPYIAAKALAYYFRSTIVNAQMSGRFTLRYGIVTTGQIKDILQGSRIAHNANMGFGKAPEQDPTGGFQITIADAPSYLPLTQV